MPAPLKNVDVQREADQLSASSASAQVLMEAICKLLHEQMLKYNWVGFYMLEGADTLVLGAFQGARRRTPVSHSTREFVEPLRPPARRLWSMT